MKKRVLSIILAVMLLMGIFVLPTPASAAAATVGTVTFSKEAGFYTQPFELELTAESGATIYYTIDGTEPTLNSTVYKGPFTVSERTDYPIQQGVSVRNNWWGGGSTTLIGNHVKTYPVVKAKAYKNGEWSKTITNTYLIDPNIFTMYGNMPVLSITVEPEDFSDRTTGMYTNYSNEDLVAQCYNEYFEGNGSFGWEHSAELKVSGHGSRGDNKKKLRLNFNKGTYEDKKSVLEYSLIENSTKNYYDRSEVTSFAKLNTRTTDWQETDMKEPLTQKIADVTHCDTADSEPSVVLINGEFWGVYDTREQYDNRYIAEHYGIDKDDVIQVSFDWDTANTKYDRSSPLYKVEYSEGPEDMEDYYLRDWYDMWSIINNGLNGKTIADDEVYEELLKRVDIESFVDYWLVYIFCDNWDAPANNLKMWRSAATFDPDYDYIANGDYGNDGRWRFFIHDFDISYNTRGLDNWNITNRLIAYTTAASPYDGQRATWATNTLKNLLTNDRFRQKMAAHLNTYCATAFAPSRTQGILDSIQEQMTVAKKYDLTRWNLGDITKWNNNVTTLRNYLSTRPANVKGYFRDYFNKNNGLNVPASFTTVNFRTDGSKGYIGVDGADTRACDYGVEMASSWSAQYFRTIPISVTATPLEGYELESITVEHDGTTQTYTTDTVTLTPASNDTAPYTVTANFKSATGVELDTAELAKLIESAKAINGAIYTADSYAVVTEKLAAAQKAIAEATTQNQIDEAYEALNNAVNNLVLKIVTTALEKAIANAQALDADDYTPDSYAALKTALDNGKAVLANHSTQKQVDDAAAAIENAIKGLVRYFDTSDLEAAIAEGEAIEPYIYSEQSFKTLTDAITAGKAVVKNATSDAEVASAAKAIRDAIDDLVVAIDVSELKKLYDQVNETDTSVYDPVTTRVLDDVMARAINVIERPESQQEVDAMLKELQDAVDGLKFRVITTELEDAIDNAKAINAELYTDASVEALNTALAAAEKIYNDPETQELVDKAAADLNAAIKALELKSAEEAYIISVNGGSADEAVYVERNETITVELKVPDGAVKLGYFNEAGKGISSSSVLKDGVWTSTFAIGTKGERTISIFANYGNGWVDTGLDVAVYVGKSKPAVTEPVEPKIISVEAPETAKAKQSFTFTVKTSKAVSNIGLFNESGSGISTTKSYVDEGDTRIWTVNTNVSSRGSRVLTVKMADAVSGWLNEGSVSFEIALTK